MLLQELLEKAVMRLLPLHQEQEVKPKSKAMVQLKSHISSHFLLDDVDDND